MMTAMSDFCGLAKAMSRLVAGCVVLLLAQAGSADDWPGPRVMTVFSEDGRRFVRVTPGTSVGETVGFAGAKRGFPANALFYEIQPDRSYRLTADVALLNPVAPVDMLLSNSGHLITFDNWHNVGYGKAVAIYSPSGRPVASRELEQLYSAGQLKAITTAGAVRRVVANDGAEGARAAGAEAAYLRERGIAVFSEKQIDDAEKYVASLERGER